jgi:glycosyltransferase involved in cell wall biosynthesis
MTSPAPDFSVIVLFGRGRLEPCQSSLLSQTETGFEIIGVLGFDPPSPPDPRVRFLKISELNPARRRNQAVAISRGKFLAFIDDDATAPTDWLVKAKNILETNPDLAGCGGSNIAPPQMNRKQQITDFILTDRYLGSGSSSYTISGQPHPARPGELHLSNFFLRREIFDTVKGFNEKIGYGGEDSEMVYQIGKKTGKVLEFIPELFVHHERREFGLELLKRNFRFRRQNGRLIWVYPKMYKWNPSLWIGMSLIPISLFFLIAFPWGFLVPLLLAAIYINLIFFRSYQRSGKKLMFSIFMPIYFFLHHCSYALGLSFGFWEGFVMGTWEINRLLARDDLE